MKNWLTKLLQELNAVSDEDVARSTPTDGVSPQDHFIGMANDEERRAYTLIENRVQRAEAILKTHQAECSSTHCSNPDDMAEFEQLLMELAALNSIFWAWMYEANPRLAGKKLNMRQGWTLVWTEPRPGPSIENLASELKLEILAIHFDHEPEGVKS